MQYKKLFPIIYVAILASCTATSTKNEARTAFNFIDKNTDNLISLNEFSSVMRQAAYSEISEEFLDADSDNSNTLSLDEVKAFGASQADFQEADKNQSGNIDLDEFVNKEIKETFIEGDLNHDNALDFSEFNRLE